MTANFIHDALNRATPASPDQIRIASAYADQYSLGEPGHADPCLLEWFEIPDYPIARLVDAVDVEWFKDQQQMWAEEGEDDRFDDMLNSPIYMPVVVYDNGQCGWTWDGNHRIGATLAKGKKEIRALVGVPPLVLKEVFIEGKTFSRPRP